MPAAYSLSQQSEETPAKIKQNKIKVQKVLKYKYEWGEPVLQGDLIFSKSYDENGNLIESKSPNARITYKYNDKGKMTQETYFNPDGSIESRFNYNYDGLGNLTEESEANVSGSFFIRTQYQYENGRRTKTILYNEDGSVKTSFKYDEKGNLLDVASFETDKSYYFNKVNKYDAKGRLTEETSLNPDGTINKKTYFTYDNSGNKIKEVRYGTDGKLEDKKTYTYDSRGKTLEAVQYNSEGQAYSKNIYRWGILGKLLEEKAFSYGNFNSRNTYLYDERGNVIEEALYGENEMLLSKTTYKYDAAGNRTEAIKYNFLDEPEMVLKYEYEFYP
jgi:YD repeat-containing protein